MGGFIEQESVHSQQSYTSLRRYGTKVLQGNHNMSISAQKLVHSSGELEPFSSTITILDPIVTTLVIPHDYVN